MTYWAIIRFTYEGVHRWKEATKNVDFLKNPHRHMFHATMWIEQHHNNRDIEYIGFKRDIIKAFKDRTDYGTMSCEQMAEMIKKEVKKIYPERRVKVEVEEDGEHGCLIE